MKVTLIYNEETGELWDEQLFVINLGLNWSFSDQAKGKQESHSKTKDLVSLKDAGFSADEIMQMKREGLI